MRWAVLLLCCSVAWGCNDRAAAPPALARAVTRAGPPAQPSRGTIHTVRMLLDDEGFRFEPGYLTVSEGDGVRFLMVSGVPHNVAFDERFIPSAARAQLVSNLAALGGRDLASPVVTVIDSTFVLSTGGLPRGEYLFYCAPHRSLNMHGVLTVR
jgi:plastocyanin